MIPFVDGLLIVLGVLMLAGRNPFERLPGVRVPIVANPYGQAYLYGVMLGPLALPCAGAFALSLIAYSIGIGETLPRIATFVAYGLGFGLPLVLLSLLAGDAAGAVRSLRRAASSGDRDRGWDPARRRSVSGISRSTGTASRGRSAAEPGAVQRGSRMTTGIGLDVRRRYSS